MIPASQQTTDKVIDGLFDACCSIFGASLDQGLGEYTGTWNDGVEDRTLTVVEAIPGSYLPDIIIGVGTDVRQQVERPTMGTNRSREIQVDVDVILSVAYAGNTTAARAARHTVNKVAEAFALRFRSGDETLGGACREAFVSNLAGPKITLAMNEAGVWGRVAEITATVTAHVRN